MSELLQIILSDTAYDKWTKYLYKRNRRLKNESEEALHDAIIALESSEKESLQQFVFYLTDLHRTVGKKIDFRVFEKIILPCLMDGISRNLPTCNRRLAEFDQMFHSSTLLFNIFRERTGNTNAFFDPANLYKKELEIDPSDQIAVDGLLKHVASQLDYAIHELPEYGLIGDLDEFDSDLKQFGTYLDLCSNKDIWNEKRARWEFVRMTWKDYIANVDNYRTYEEYLRMNHLIWGD